MDVVTGWRDVPAQARGAVLAIGNFDGVHRGHQAVLGRARDLAKEMGKRSGAVVFEPHPREFFAPDQPFFRLTPLPVKLELLAALGLDETFVIEFGPELAGLSAETFATEVVAKGLGAAHVV
ncbi:MAG TPA: adenylyltransferase/cytidyltransferase family protein, partial [Methyloceanibacter sp.]|nr:adenylyltransferase/cytidyltransferase family protein [Methyloceanibacter sp.]